MSGFGIFGYMEVICIQTEAFYALVDEVYEYCKQKDDRKESKWVNDKVAMGLLEIKSKATLQKYRDEGRIRFSQPTKRKILYDRDSIDEYLEKKAKETF
tara:strand:- start:3 stop:299 length:297 start_codon:yes stop_codon:yes gene_type:complete